MERSEHNHNSLSISAKSAKILYSMKTGCKIIIGVVVALAILVSCLWLIRDNFISSYLEETVASKLNVVLKIDRFKSQPFKGLSQWRIEASGTVEGATFTGNAQLSLFPLEVIKHQLNVTRFPLTDLNTVTRKYWGFEFARGWTDIHSWGAIHRERIEVRAKLHLQEFELAGDNIPSELAGDENLLNMLVHVTGLPLEIAIEGNPHNPKISWKRALPAGLNMMKGFFGPLFEKFQLPTKNKPPSESP